MLWNKLILILGSSILLDTFVCVHVFLPLLTNWVTYVEHERRMEMYEEAYSSTHHTTKVVKVFLWLLAAAPPPISYEKERFNCTCLLNEMVRSSR